MAFMNSAALLAVSNRGLPNKYTIAFTASDHRLAAVLNSKWPGTDCVSGTTIPAAGGFVMLGLDHWCVVSMTRTAGTAAQGMRQAQLGALHQSAGLPTLTCNTSLQASADCQQQASDEPHCPTRPSGRGYGI